MYLKHPEGTQMELQGITVNIPKTGYVFDFFTKKWVKTGVYSRSPKREDQYWERHPLPDWYPKKRKEEEKKIIQTGDIDFVIEECELYREQEWFRRMNGFWFMNYGEPTYITGLYYMYLNWWQIDIGFPRYFNYDRKRFYHIDYCNKDPFSFGRLEVGPRRMGKTYVGGIFVYEPVSRTKNSNGGIQSKTSDDAKKVFAKAIISAFRKLPHFFRPVFDTSSGSIPKTELRFFNTSKKGANVKAEDMEEELESIIDFRSSGKFSYDGEKLLTKLDDEIFKTEGVDVYDRYLVVKECLVDNTTEEIIGKYMGSSTVEEVEGQLDSYEKFWKESDPEKRNANGHTESGLYRYFISAVETRGVDKYGNCDEKKNFETITNAINAFTDAQKKSDYRRKYPFSIKDAFRPRASDCHYDIDKLNDRYDLLAVVPENYIAGDLEWISPANPAQKKDLDIFAGVKFVKKSKGKFIVHKDIDLNDGTWNQIIKNGSRPSPGAKTRGVIGIDPFDHKTTVDGRKSNGSGDYFLKFNPLSPINSDKFMISYCCRPKRPSIFYEDMLKLCVITGAEMLFEDQKQGIRQYFDGMHCTKYMMHLPERNEPGIPATTKTHQAIVDHTMEYIDQCIDLVDFPEHIDDWIKFDINNTTKFDKAMSTGYALLAANRIKPSQPKEDKGITEVMDIFPMYN